MSSPESEAREELEEALREAVHSTAPVQDPAESAISPQRKAHREAAAVVGPFSPQDLMSIGHQLGEDLAEGAGSIAPDCDVAAGGKWLLRSEIRTAVLAQLVDEGRLFDALAATQHLDKDPYRRAVEEIAKGEPLPLQGRSIEELRHLKQVLKWFGEAAPANFDLDEIDRAYRSRRLVEPFHRLADGFHGREKELEELRDFVEVYAASGKVESFERGVRSGLGIQRRQPWVIWGPGGIGKSALISRFVLEHAEIGSADSIAVEGPEKIPFAYLDFDKVELDPLRPESLALEIAEQLVKQYPDKDLEEDIASWKPRIRRAQRRGPRTGPFGPRERNARSDEELYEAIVERLYSWLEANPFGGGPDQPPFLLVLDTFEEVQLSGEARERQIGSFVDRFRDIYPRLRVAICGRAKVRFLKASHHHLGGLDESAALALLEDREIDEPELREMIVSRVGTSPLSLILAAQVVAAEGSEDRSRALDEIRTRNLLLQQVDAAEIQGQLYERILKHIRDLRVRQLAHPGLVVRRITADIIREVLAEPCGLDPDDADELFEALKRNVSLVDRNQDGSLQHRSDVRRVMLRNMQSSSRYADTILTIHKAAAEYYSAQKPSTSINKGEEVYHLLMLGEVGDELKSLAQSADRRSLELAWQDPLPPRSQAWLARFLDLETVNVDWTAAELDDWEWHTATQVEQLLAIGESGRALKMLRERKERSPGSPLFALEVRALEADKRIEPALEVASAGLDSALGAGQTTQALTLSKLGAQLALKADDAERFERFLNHGLDLAYSGQDEAARLALVKLRRDGRMRLEAEEELDADEADIELVRAFLRTSDQVLQDEGELTGSIVLEIGADNPTVLEHAIRSLKPVDPGPVGRKGLAALLEKADESPEFHQRKQALLREIGVTDDEAPWKTVAEQSVQFGTLDKSLLAVVRYGELETDDLQSVAQILNPAGSGASTVSV